MDINVGECLRVAQARKNVSNRELATRMDKSEQQISRWRSQRDLRIQRVEELCEALKMDIREFLSG